MIIILWIFLVILGWLVGACVNYLSDVLPWRRKLVHPFCLQCSAQLSFRKYFFWDRKCEACGKRRSLRTWVVELIFVALSLALWYEHPEKLGFWLGGLVLAFFAVVVVIDIEHRLILHPVSWFGAGLGLLVGSYLHGTVKALLGGAVGFGSMFLLYGLGELFLRFMAKKRGEKVDDVALGFGDVNLSGVLGLMLGYPGIILGLFLAVMAGGLISLLYLIVMIVLKRYRMFMALPYGPFLIAGATVLLFMRDWLASLF